MKFSISKFLVCSKILYARIDVNPDDISIDLEDNQKLVSVASSTAPEITEPLAHFPACRISQKENYFTFIKVFIERKAQIITVILFLTFPLT